MNIRIKIIVAIFIVIAICVIVNMIRNKSLELKYALAWLIVGICVLILDLFPGLMDWMAKLMGIASSVNMLFFLGFCFSLVIIFTLTISISRMSIQIKKLAQKLALYEKQVDEKCEL